MATRNLRITSCNEVYRGNGAKGEYVIYEVEAVDATTGILINVPLRSFSHLTEGEAGTFNVDKYERPGKETTYTLSKPKGSGGGGNALGPKVDDLRKRVELLEQNLDLMRRAVAALEAQAQQSAQPVAAGGSMHSGGGAAPPHLDDPDDIPF